MSKMVKVVNKNIHPFSQEHQGVMLTIPAGGYIEMEYCEAEDFIGTYSPMWKGADDQPDPRSFKKLVIEKPKGFDPHHRPRSFKCQACGFEARDEDELRAHSEVEHLDAMADDDAKEEAIERKKAPKKAWKKKPGPQKGYKLAKKAKEKDNGSELQEYTEPA
jgi:hypothetical protein